MDVTKAQGEDLDLDFKLIYLEFPVPWLEDDQHLDLTNAHSDLQVVLRLEEDWAEDWH